MRRQASLPDVVGGRRDGGRYYSPHPGCPAEARYGGRRPGPLPRGEGESQSSAWLVGCVRDLSSAGTGPLSRGRNDSVGDMDRPHPPSLRFGATGPVPLPRGEGTRFRPRWEFTKRWAFSNAGKSSPSPWGEGRGEGKRSFSTESFRRGERAGVGGGDAPASQPTTVRLKSGETLKALSHSLFQASGFAGGG